MVARQGCNSDGEPYGGFYVEHESVGIDCSKDGLTRQEFAAECDINVLMERYERGGVLSHINSHPGEYFDASEVPNLAQALAIAADAEDAFMRLPAAARREFDNDPVKFVTFAGDPANLERMREWGLAPPKAVPEPPMRVEVINPAPAPGAPADAPKGA